MASVPMPVMVLLTIGLIVSHEQASARKCYQCTSLKDAGCEDEPSDELLKECEGDLSTVQLLKAFKSKASEPTSSEPSGQDATNANISETTDAAVDEFHPDVFMRSQKLQRRDVSPAGSDYYCAVATVKVFGRKGFVRDCVAISGVCEDVFEDLKDLDDVTLTLCTTDGCNTSSRLSLGLMSVILPVGLFTLSSY